MPRNVVLTKVTRPPGTLTVERTSTMIKQHECHCRLESPLQNQVAILKQKIFPKKRKTSKTLKSRATLEINFPELLRES